MKVIGVAGALYVGVRGAHPSRANNATLLPWRIMENRGKNMVIMWTMLSDSATIKA